jgi:hypothetical protein
MFRNHTHFVELRNRINRQEHKHMKMFDKINLKLQDRAFVQQTFKLSSGEAAAAKASIPGDELPNKSPGTSKATAIQFINEMNEQVSVLWVTFDGEEARYATLKAGEKYTQQTYDQHVWLIRGADDRKIMKFAAKETASDCIIKGGDDEGSGAPKTVKKGCYADGGPNEASCACRAVPANQFTDGTKEEWPGVCRTSSGSGGGTPWCYVVESCAKPDGISKVGGGPWKYCDNHGDTHGSLGSKDGNNRAIPVMISSGQGCGAQGKANCEKAAKEGGYNTFGM